MYSIFLVDDEVIELEMMRDFIHWEEMDIYVAGTATNGKEAMEKINVIQPDIILTDVNMPMMNGIELSKLVSKQFDWIKIVFLTGYDEFQYVKSALDVGAVGYLLKPLDIEEIANVMDKVKQKCEEVRQHNKSIQVTKATIMKELIYESSDERKQNLVNSYCKLERSREAGSFTLVLCHIDERSLSQNTSLNHCVAQLTEYVSRFLEQNDIVASFVSPREGELAILIEAGQSGLSRRLWTSFVEHQRESLPFTATLSVGETYVELIHIHSQYELTKKALAEQFYVGYGKVIFAEDKNFDSDQVPPFSNHSLLEALQEIDQDQAINVIREYFSTLIMLRIRKKNICDWAIALIDSLAEQSRDHRVDRNGDIGAKGDLYHSIYECHTIHEIEEIVIQSLKHSFERIQDRSADRNSKLVQQVIDILNETYDEQLTIVSLSSQVYLSPNYLRSIFKEKTGTTIHDYLTKVRLEKAKDMLSDASLRIHDIARGVGYESTSYFISLFLKNEGVTPNEYRKSL